MFLNYMVKFLNIKKIKFYILKKKGKLFYENAI